MPLSHQENEELAERLALLERLDEPEAMVAALAQVARMQAAKASLTPQEAARWHIVADALIETEARINAANAPESRKFAEHLRQWPAAELSQGQPAADRYDVIDNTIEEMTRLRERNAELERLIEGQPAPAEPEGAQSPAHR